MDREAFWGVYWDTKNHVNRLSQISVGSVNSAIVHPREVFKVAIMTNATSILTVHNHPSGDPTASPEDRAVTNQLKYAGQTLGIRLLDHVIVGDGSYYSFAD